MRFIFTQLVISMALSKECSKSVIKAVKTGEKISKGLTKYHLKPQRKSLTELYQEAKEKVKEADK